MLFNINLPVEIISGEKCVTKNYDKFARMGKKAFLVTGKNSARKSGALGDVLTAFQKANVECMIFDEIEPNPMLSTCFRGGRKAKEYGADFVVGIGGGSSLDAAKAISCFAASGFEVPEMIFADCSRNIPSVTIGTTTGTGSEVNGAAVLTDDKSGEKRTINAVNLFARYCFVDYRYTYSNSYLGTVSTGLDALCHAIEDWFSSAATEPACTAGRRATELVYPWLKDMSRGVFDPQNRDMRRDMYYGSLWAGIAITMVGTGFPHTMGYPLTEIGHIPHGVACAIFEREFLRVSLPHADERQKNMLLNIIGSLEEFGKVIDRLTVNDLMVNNEMAELMVRRGVESINGRRTLGGLSEDEATSIVRNSVIEEKQEELLKGGWLLKQ